MTNTLWNDLFNSLNKADFKRIERYSSLSLNDIEQEARLICWQIVKGDTLFDPSQGSVQAFIMGKLWGLSYRNPISHCSLSTDSEVEEINKENIIDYLQHHQQESVNDPLSQLIEVEDNRQLELYQQHIRLTTQNLLNDKDKNFFSLSLSLSIAELSTLFSITPRAVRYRQETLIKKINHLNNKIKSTF
ncbi:hypothetical protein LHV13_03290 [Ferrovum sp. PN-J185]|uniref:hypothetical protein n=1 Tax=Ferrovum sp. PN-J185 TaxID=1356306 RepID=UPI00079B6D63|nr:hypothetical protein [Ferrovum sp. PN-J185]KXW56451.1 hypothetical protein FV185_04000 [Ferrovum sp. PN-J185]MCC6068200.1 hypothetical protein [Ferrovum sp. PN-J185]MDE1891687.1 hypothetical protein [Betaproteobacteria bacterium]MDE2056471.1 hypothetical protein [Betaproteobacteria bacterium]